MSSLARTRSLRKPGTTSTESTTAGAKEAGRHGSPSRLPVMPQPRTVSTASSTAASSLGPKPSRSASSSSSRAVSTRKPADPAKKEVSRYPPSTTTTRATSITRPTSSGSGQPTQTRRIPAHTRAKSTTTATTLNTSNTLRPPTQGTRTAHTRTASTERTAKPGISAHATTRAQQQQQQQQAQPRLRPAFSTLQQHYSPAKTRDPKPLTATYLAPPSPSKLPANIAASAETGRLQAELLQLHLVHRDAATVEAQWRASAKEKLGERFAKLREATQEVAEEERAGLEQVNVLALRNWAASGGLEEKIQALDAIVSGLWTLSEPGGRYARMVRRFERWMDQVYEVEEARGSDAYLTAAASQQSLFIGELDASWKDDCSGVLRRLEGWRRQLRDIGETREEEGNADRSSLSRMLEGSRALLHSLLEAVNLMQEIEEEALAKEEQWIEKMNKEEAIDDTPKAGAIWRAV